MVSAELEPNPGLVGEVTSDITSTLNPSSTPGVYAALPMITGSARPPNGTAIWKRSLEASNRRHGVSPNCVVVDDVWLLCKRSWWGASPSRVFGLLFRSHSICHVSDRGSLNTLSATVSSVVAGFAWL